MKPYIVIPTYQEAENIDKLLNELSNYTVIIVDDSSPDGTAEIARKYNNTVVISRPSKLGLGSAVRDGIRKALADPECTCIVTMDSDYSHDPKDVVRLVGADCVIGSRYALGGKIIGWNTYRKLTSRVANLVCRVLLRTGVTDNTTNFRAYSRKCAETLLLVEGKNYEWPVLCLATIRRHGFKAHEIPVTFVNRRNGDSKLSSKHILKWLGFVLRESLK